MFFLLQKGSLFLHYKPESMSILYWGGVWKLFSVPTFRILGGGVGFPLVILPVALLFARVNLDSVGMLVSRLGGGSGVGFHPFGVYPLPAGQEGGYITSPYQGPNCSFVPDMVIITITTCTGGCRASILYS